MLRLLPLVGLSTAAVWPGQNTNLTASWPSNGSDRPAGGIYTFDSAANQIVNGTGSCTITFDPANLAISFIHFFDADVGVYNPVGQEWTVHAMGAWQDQGSFSFLINSDNEPEIANVDVQCQNDSPVPDGEARLSSFPQDIRATGAEGSFRIQGRDVTSNSHHEGEPATDYTDTVVLSFPVDSRIANFTMHDQRLAVSQTGDAFTITNLGFANYYDVYFEFDYGTADDGSLIVVASYEVDAQVVPA